MEYPRPDAVLWHLVKPALSEYLSLTSRNHLRPTHVLMCLVGLGALVKASLLYIHNHPGWYDVLRQVLLLTVSDGALLSLVYHIWSLGQGLGAAAHGSPQDHSCWEAQPCIDGVV